MTKEERIRYLDAVAYVCLWCDYGGKRCKSCPVGKTLDELVSINLDQELVDDDTLEGGIAHAGETLREFLDEVGLPYNTPVDEINKALVECGIRPILAK